MDGRSLIYYCPRCNLPVNFASGLCPVCGVVVPTTIFQARNGEGRAPTYADNAANFNNHAYVRTYSEPDNSHFPIQPLPPLPSSSSNTRGRGQSLKFIHHSGPPTRESVRTARACISCYNSVKCLPGPSPECCDPCKDKNRYCRGPIDAPVLIDTGLWFKNALASLQPQCGSLETAVNEGSIYSLSIEVNGTGAIAKFDLELHNIDSHAAIPHDPSSITRVLDMVFSADQKAGLNAGSPAPRRNSDDNNESVVRRFVACAMLLHSTALSGIDQSLCEHTAAPYVTLEFIRRLSQEACDLFYRIFYKAHEFANLKPRNKLTFVRFKRLFGFNLGLIYSSVQSLIWTKSIWFGSNSMSENIYNITPAVLEKLEWLAMGFNKKEFIEGRHCLCREPIEVHIALSSLQRRPCISDSSSNQVDLLGDNPVPDVPPVDNPIAQALAGQSPGQLADSSLLQPSEETMVGNFGNTHGLAKELERMPQNDLHEPHSSPVGKTRFQMTRAITKLKLQEAAIRKHSVKKAALEEKLKVWQPDSIGSPRIVESNECNEKSSQSQPAIEGRVRELKAALKQQDGAMQKHYFHKDALEREVKLLRRILDLEIPQHGLAGDESLRARSKVPRLTTASIANNTNDPLSVPQILHGASPDSRDSSELHYVASVTSCSLPEPTLNSGLGRRSLPPQMSWSRALDRPVPLSSSSYGLAPINDQSLEYSRERKPYSAQVASADVGFGSMQSYFEVDTGQRNASPRNIEDYRRETGTAGSAIPYLYGGPWTPHTGPKKETGRAGPDMSYLMSYLQRSPREAPWHAMDVLATHVGRMDINSQSTPKSEGKKIANWDFLPFLVSVAREK